MDKDLLRDFLMEAFPNPERNGCPDFESLQAIAENRLPFYPVLKHMASCSECYREYYHLRMDHEEACFCHQQLQQ